MDVYHKFFPKASRCKKVRRTRTFEMIMTRSIYSLEIRLKEEEEKNKISKFT